MVCFSSLSSQNPFGVFGRSTMFYQYADGLVHHPKVSMSYLISSLAPFPNSDFFRNIMHFPLDVFNHSEVSGCWCWVS